MWKEKIRQNGAVAINLIPRVRDGAIRCFMVHKIQLVFLFLFFVCVCSFLYLVWPVCCICSCINVSMRVCEHILYTLYSCFVHFHQPAPQNNKNVCIHLSRVTSGRWCPLRSRNIATLQPCISVYVQYISISGLK